MKNIPTFVEFLNESKSLLATNNVYDIQFPGKDSSNGWKLSILGKTLADAEDLWNRLHDYLIQNNIPHKFGTQKRINHPDKEQSKKLVTIYIPNDMTVKTLAPEIEKRLKGYSGWHNIKTPTSYEHWGNAIFFRNDRNEAGEYVKAKNK